MSTPKEIHLDQPKAPDESKKQSPPEVYQGTETASRFNSIRQTIPLAGNKPFKRSMRADHQVTLEREEEEEQKRLSGSDFGRQRHSLQALHQQQGQSGSPSSASGSHHRKSSGSPAWCSTSDSAFSHSQTTLGSESGNSSNSLFARQSIKGSSGYSENSSSSISNKSINSSKEEEEEDLMKQQKANNEPPDDGEHPSGGSCELEPFSGGNFFNIIWRNLSYKVPEKRFSKSKAFLRRQCRYFFAKVEDNQQTDDDEINQDPPTQENITNKPPPLRAPTTGRPRSIIFQNLNGCVKSGQLTAILGPSGAGKTTLLKCLTNSIVEGVSGQIDIVDRKQPNNNEQNSNKATSSQHHLKLCIIPQKDYLFDNLTVMENLVFASRIKNTQVNFKHLENVDRVAKLLGLQSCLKLKTGKLSGGQYKRVSIAQELLSKPDILILDEPTSGLDSLTCFKTVSVLRDLVDKSRAGLIPPLAIVMTIHQPQIKIFNLFHQVYIMSSQGQCVYEGRPEYLLETVFDCCKLTPPPDDANPASFIIDLASEVYGLEPIEKLIKFQHQQSLNINSGRRMNDESNQIVVIEPLSLIGANLKSNPLSLIQASNGKLDRSCCNLNESVVDVEGDNFSTNSKPNKLQISDRLKRRNIHDGNFWLHTNLLVKRLWKSTWRDPLLTKTRLIFHITIPFVFYFIYSQKSGAANACPQVEREFNFKSMASNEYVERLGVQHNELILTFENVSLFFLLLYSFSMCVLAVTALSFPLNMQILLKETSNGWYSMPRFVMAKTLADLPMELTMPIISVSIAYYLTGQPSSYLCWRMLAVTAVMTLCSLISQTQGLLFGAYFMNNVQAAVFISQASSLPWIMLSGFTTRVSELPKLLQWLSFGSIYRLGIESIVSIRYGYNMCPCDAEIVDSGPARVVGIPDQLRSLMKYYMDVYSSDANANSLSESLVINQTTTTIAPSSDNTGDVFEQIASTLSRANTYGVDIVNCGDVRPYILTAREVDEGTLPIFLLILFCILVALKILLFCIISQ